MTKRDHLYCIAYALGFVGAVVGSVLAVAVLAVFLVAR